MTRCRGAWESAESSCERRDGREGMHRADRDGLDDRVADIENEEAGPVDTAASEKSQCSPDDVQSERGTHLRQTSVKTRNQVWLRGGQSVSVGALEQDQAVETHCEGKR